jgi:hypothetical protein
MPLRRRGASGVPVKRGIKIAEQLREMITVGQTVRGARWAT